MVQITLEDNSPILATDQHPFWSETRAAYVPAVEIYKGEELRDAKNNRITVRSTRVYTEDLLAYNLTIRNIHTYYAGESPVLVHNCAASGGHRKNARPSTRSKHEKADTRRQNDQRRAEKRRADQRKGNAKRNKRR